MPIDWEKVCPSDKTRKVMRAAIAAGLGIQLDEEEATDNDRKRQHQVRSILYFQDLPRAACKRQRQGRSLQRPSFFGSKRIKQRPKRERKVAANELQTCWLWDEGATLNAAYYVDNSCRSRKILIMGRGFTKDRPPSPRRFNIDFATPDHQNNGIL